MLSVDEREAFERHLIDCVQCQQQLEKDRAVVARLDESAPAADPSPALRSRIMSEIARDLAATRPEPEPSVRYLPRNVIHRRALLAPIAAIVVFTLALGYLLGHELVMRQELLSTPLVGQVTTPSSVIVHRSGATEVALKGLPDPPPGHVYVAWVVGGDGTRAPAATYDDGNGMFDLNVSALGKTVEITVEPTPTEGVPRAPSMSPILWARVGQP